MDEKHLVTVNGIIALACREFRFNEREIRSNEREAITRKIRRYLQADGHSRPYKLTLQEADRLVTTDLSSYFLRVFGMPEQAKDARQRLSRAKKSLELRTYYLNRARPHEEDGAQEMDADYEIPESTLESFRLKAIFHKLFPEFDEERFRKEYRECLELQEYLGSLTRPDSTENLKLAIRLEELSGRVSAVLKYGTIDAYLVAKVDE